LNESSAASGVARRRITLTMNSSVDLHYDVARLEPVKKLLASEPLVFPGGGGINVSRVIKELGSHSIAVIRLITNTGVIIRTVWMAHVTFST
jgi:fructose-1-phosphate kinase PfkB-like protein